MVYKMYFSPLPKDLAWKQLRKYSVVSNYTQISGSGKIVDLTKIPSNRPITYIGDLHANLTNLERFLYRNYDQLRQDKMVVNILGDAVHERKKDDSMDTSIVMMQNIFDLKINNPNSFFYYAGNHDSFSPNFSVKDGNVRINPGPLMLSRLVDLYGQDYVDLFQKCLYELPIFSIANGVVSVHGSPVKGSFTMQTLEKLSLKEDDYGRMIDPLAKQALWGRYDPENKHRYSYTLNDVNNFLSQIGQPKATLLVAHTEPDNGNWYKKLAENHYVIYGKFYNSFGYAQLKDGKLSFIDIEGKPLDPTKTICCLKNYVLVE